jgi:hypothetical protein
MGMQISFHKVDNGHLCGWGSAPPKRRPIVCFRQNGLGTAFSSAEAILILWAIHLVILRGHPGRKLLKLLDLEFANSIEYGELARWTIETFETASPMLPSNLV